MGRKTLRVRWTHPALADLIEAQAYIARENPTAARAIALRVWDAAQQLGEHPEIGRDGYVPETREWVVSQTPYLLVYRLKDDTVEILRVWHGKRKREGGTTRIRPSENATPPSTRAGPKPSPDSVMASVEKAAPSAMKAPASTANASVSQTRSRALATPTSSTRWATSAGA
jgi:toxin ParE1/3/4